MVHGCLDWRRPQVAEHVEEVLRFWLDRGVDGLRIDVAPGPHERNGLPDPELASGWRALAEEYTDRTGRERVLVGEVGALDSDELHQAFFFEFRRAPWDADALSQVIDRRLGTIAAHESPMGWVLNKHDLRRGDVGLGLTRARAAALLMLALPGSSYLHQGERLGGSRLHLYREAIGLRHRVPAFTSGGFRWLPSEPGVLAFTRGDAVACVVNCSARTVSAPTGSRLLLGSDPEVGDELPPDTAGWYLVEVAHG